MTVGQLKGTLAGLTGALFYVFLFATVPLAGAQFNQALGDLCTNNPESVACQEIEAGSGGDNPVTSTTQTIVNIMSVVIATIAVVVIIIAGITMTLSQGDSGKIKNSRDAIIYSAVGLVVVAISRTIIIFIINRTS